MKVVLRIIYAVAGKIMAADVKAGPAKSVEGNNIKITIGNSGVMVDKAYVITDIKANNGVIHVIDSVMIPN